MFKEFIHLIYFKIKSNLKISLDLSTQGLIKNIGSILLYGIFFVGSYYFAYNTIQFLIEKANVGLYLFHKLLAILLFVFFISVHIGNVVVSYSTFYKSREVMFLFNKPVSFKNIFLVKFLDNFFYSSTTLLLIGVAVILAYGNYFSMNIIFYPFVIIFIFLPFLLISATLGSLVLFAIIKLSTKYKFIPVLGSFISIYIVFLYLYFHFSNPYNLVENVLQKFPEKGISLSGFKPFFIKYFPNYWISEFLYWTLKGNMDLSISYALLLLMISIAMFLIVMYIAGLYFRKSYLTLQDMNLSIRKNKTRTNLFSKITLKNQQTDVLFKKELLMFFREPSQWIQFSIMILFMLIFALSMMSFGFKTTDPFLKTVSYVAIFLFVAFLIASFALRFIFPAVSWEYKNFWKLRSAPIDLKKIYNTKLIYYGLPTIIFGLFLVLFSHFPLIKETELLKISLISILLTSIVLVIFNISAGSYFSNFSEKSPVRIASTQSASLTFLLSLLYLGFVSLIVASTAYVYFESSNLQYQFYSEIINRSLFILFIISTIISIFSYFVGTKSLKKDFL